MRIRGSRAWNITLYCLLILAAGVLVNEFTGTIQTPAQTKIERRIIKQIGEQGARGVPGPTTAGQAGQTGSRGLLGPAGTQGQTGARGLLGPQGLTGPTGRGRP